MADAQPSIEIIRDVPATQYRQAVFDFDGTLSLLREGWERIMAPTMIEMICGSAEADPEIVAEVDRFIADTTGIHTLQQMEGLVEMVGRHALVPESQRRDALGYKKVYIDRLLVPVRERLARLESGEVTPEASRVRGSLGLLDALCDRGIDLYLFSGTDHDDVRNEADKLGVLHHFKDVWGAQDIKNEFSKEDVLRKLAATSHVGGSDILVIGDGPVEIRHAKQFGCTALGVASNDKTGHGWNPVKRQRLIDAGADMLVSDFSDASNLLRSLFGS